MATNVWLSTANGNWNTVGNWSLGAVPTTGVHVIIPAGSPSITTMPTGAGITDVLGNVLVEDGYTGTIGNVDGIVGSTDYLSITPANLTFAGSGLAFINVNAAAISPLILNTAAKANPYSAGLFLLGSAFVTVQIKAGDVGIALRPGETATVAAVKLECANGGSCQAGSGLTLNQWLQTGGDGLLNAAATLINLDAGTLVTRGTGAIAGLNVFGGTLYPEATGVITTLGMAGGVTDFRSSRASRTVTTPTISAGAILHVTTDVTFTNKLAFSGACRLEATAAY